MLPVARKLGINKRIGWHTFRHTYSTVLRSAGAELKIMQERLRHSTIRRLQLRSAVPKRRLLHSCSRKKHQNDEERRLGLEPVPILCLFVPTGKRSTCGKCLKENGGTTGLEPGGLCRDRQQRDVTDCSGESAAAFLRLHCDMHRMPTGSWQRCNLVRESTFCTRFRRNQRKVLRHRNEISS